VRSWCIGRAISPCAVLAGLFVASLVHAQPVVKRVVFIGDSLTANKGVTSSQQYPALVAGMLGNVLVQNLGRPGANAPMWAPMAGIAKLLSPGLFPVSPIVVLLGTNDWDGEPISAFITACTQILSAIPAWTAIVCVTPPWMANEGQRDRNGATLEDYRAAVRTACAGHVVVEGRTAIPNEPKYFGDRLHPNAQGNRRLAQAVAQSLRKLL
jgi:lysophospholipase L1-like esterase